MPNEIEISSVPLPEPRPLTIGEKELLDFLLSAVDSPELRAQAETAVVWAVCSCGCASINLRVTDDAPRAALVGPEVRQNAVAEIRASGINADGEEIDVTLHIWSLDENHDVREGGAVIGELEIWPTVRPLREDEVENSWFGYKKPPPVTALRFLTRE